MRRLLLAAALGALLGGCQLDRGLLGPGLAPSPLGSVLPPPAPHAEFFGSDPLPRVSLARASRAAPPSTRPGPLPGSPLAPPPPAGTDL
jgi:hypothetical protein